MKRRGRPPTGKSYNRTTVSLDDEVTVDASHRAARLGYESFTAYVEALIKYDLAELPDHETLRKDAEAPETGKVRRLVIEKAIVVQPEGKTPRKGGLREIKLRDQSGPGASGEHSDVQG